MGLDPVEEGAFLACASGWFGGQSARRSNNVDSLGMEEPRYGFFPEDTYLPHPPGQST